MKPPRQRTLRVRVAYEPNRFSDDCLEKIYEQLHPTSRREVTSANRNKVDKSEPQKREKGQL